jgi:hypothetical protein
VREVAFFRLRRARGGKEMAGRGQQGSWGTFYVLSSWPRRQVTRGAWRTCGGDGLQLSATRALNV